MKRPTLLVLLVLTGIVSISLRAAQGPPADPVAAMLAAKPAAAALTVEKARDNLFVIRGTGGNIAAFVTSRGVVLVDSGLPGWGQVVLDKLKTVTDKPVTTLINTHVHFDHAAGNVEFPPTVEIVTHENTKKYMQDFHPVYGVAAAPRTSIYTEHPGHGIATRTYKTQLTIGSGDERVELRYYGRAHTGGDTFVIFPELGIAHVGDVFPNKGLPIMDRNNGGSGVAYPDTLAKAGKAILGSVDRVIPGHSAVTTPQAFRDYTEFITTFVGSITAAAKAGKTAEQALAEYKPAEKFASYAVQRGKADVDLIYKEIQK